MFKWFILFVFILGRISAQETSRAINSTGLWSKYNLIVKPTLGSPITISKTTTASSVIESKYATIDIRDEAESQEEEEPEEEEEEDDKDEEVEDYEHSDEVEHHKYTHHKQGIKKRPRPQIVESSTTQRSHKVHKTHLKPKPKKHKKVKVKGLKKLKKYMLPLLLAYKLKFFTLVPLLLGGLVLMVATTGFAGFFFALFAVGVGLKKD